jgi:RarD protein
MNPQHNRRASLAALAASMLIFGTIGLFRRWIPLSSGLLSLTRAVLGTLFLLGFCALKRRRLAQLPPLGQSVPLLLSGALMGFNWILLFEAYRFTTVAVATLCYYMQPTILIVLSPLLLGEKLNGRKLLCAGAAVVGMVLVSGVGTGDGTGDVRGIALGLSAAALYAAIIILNKKLTGVDPFQRTVFQLGAAALTLLPYELLTEQWSSVRLTAPAAAALMVVGLVHTGLAYTLYFSSVEALSGQTLALMSYIDPASALLFSALLLREPLGARGAAGAVLILASAAISELFSTPPSGPEPA